MVTPSFSRLSPKFGDGCALFGGHIKRFTLLFGAGEVLDSTSTAEGDKVGTQARRSGGDLSEAANDGLRRHRRAGIGRDGHAATRLRLPLTAPCVVHCVMPQLPFADFPILRLTGSTKLAVILGLSSYTYGYS